MFCSYFFLDKVSNYVQLLQFKTIYNISTIFKNYDPVYPYCIVQILTTNYLSYLTPLYPPGYLRSVMVKKVGRV